MILGCRDCIDNDPLRFAAPGFAVRLERFPQAIRSATAGCSAAPAAREHDGPAYPGRFRGAGAWGRAVGRGAGANHGQSGSEHHLHYQARQQPDHLRVRDQYRHQRPAFPFRLRGHWRWGDQLERHGAWRCQDIWQPGRHLRPDAGHRDQFRPDHGRHDRHIRWSGRRQRHQPGERDDHWHQFGRGR
jgi:hypothetical protein